MSVDYREDIPESAARAAHNGTSFVPERRAQQERDSYHQTLTVDLESLTKLADTPEEIDLLAAEFQRYREGYKRKVLAWLHSRSRIVSTMIAGPANFPVRQMEKRGDVAHKRLQDLLAFRKRALKAIRRKLTPESRPIMSGDSDAAQRLEQQISEAEARQKLMKDVNAAHRRFLKDPASFEGSDLPADMVALIRRYEPNYSWEPHPFAPYQLTNNNANIRRMKQRLSKIKTAQAKPDTVRENGGITIEDSPSDNRVRLFFPGKPGEDVRTTLKKHGFRWAPSLGCWQAYRNSRSLAFAGEFAG